MGAILAPIGCNDGSRTASRFAPYNMNEDVVSLNEITSGKSWPAVGSTNPVHVAILSLFAGTGYAVLAVICILLTRDAGNIAALWLPNALLVGVLVRVPLAAWPYYLLSGAIASVWANMGLGDSLPVSLGLLIANFVEIGLAAGLLRWRLGRRLEAERPDHAAMFVLFACVAAPAAAATFGAGVVNLAFEAPYWAIWKVWFVGDVMGMVLLAPAVLFVSMRDLHLVTGQRFIEMLIVLAATALFLGIVLAQSHASVLFLIFPAILWAAMRFGVVGCSLLATVMTVAVVWGTALGSGPIAAMPDMQMAGRILHLQSFFGTSVISGYLIAVFLRQRAKAEAILEGAIANMPEAFVLFGAGGRLLTCNERYREFFSEIADILVPGTKVEEILKTIAERGLVAEARGRAGEFLTERMASLGNGLMRDGLVQGERQIADGRWIAIHESRLEDGSLVMVMTDITQLKAREEKLRQSNEELEKFAYVASHDLQEPLRKVQAFGDRLKSRFSEELPDDAKMYVERMRASADRMQQLIHDLLDFSRVSTMARPFETVDLEKIAREAMADLEVPIAEADAKITISDLPEVQGDPMQLRQLFQNLISNAVKFLEPGRPPAIEISSQHVSSDVGRPQVEIRIADNGIGFDEKHADRIFDVFQRLHGRDAYDGTGVGLAVCRKIAERHDGSIRAESEPGSGATFFVTLAERHRDSGEDSS